MYVNQPAGDRVGPVTFRRVMLCQPVEFPKMRGSALSAGQCPVLQYGGVHCFALT
jgi:hypothetical protein